MPRIARKFNESNYYHVIVQGINKEFIFKDEKYMESYKRIILKKLKEIDIKILAYCIMINHAHFLIYSENSSMLSKFMQKVNTSYSRLYNKENNRVGYVFRDRFYSKNILNENQLYNCLRYIHNNPVKAKIVNSMSEYKYSSYNEYLKKEEIISKDSKRLLFGSKENYREQFDWIHNNSCEENFYDVQEENKEEINDFFSQVEKRYGMKISEIKKEKVLLKVLVKHARSETDITICKLAEILDISKSTIGRYCK